jgi:multiple sugar transport system substrate-binding protein
MKRNSICADDLRRNNYCGSLYTLMKEGVTMGKQERITCGSLYTLMKEGVTMGKQERITRRGFLVAGGAFLGATALSASRPASILAAPAVLKKSKVQWIEYITPEISEAKMQDLLAAFYKTDAGKRIEIERVPTPYGQMYDKILTLHLAGQAPDIILVDPAWGPGLAIQGVLDPLNSTLEKAGKEWTKNLIESVTVRWKGAQYNVPLTILPLCLLYNERKLEEAGFSGPPKTWADVEAMGPKLTDPTKNTYAFTAGMAAQSPYQGAEKEIFPLIYQGNDTIFKNGKCNLNSPASVSALKWWLKLVLDLKIMAPGVFTNRPQDKNEQFTSELVAFNQQSLAHVKVSLARNPKLKLGLAAIPEGKTYGSVVSGWTAGISRTSKNKKAAWEFLQWLVGPEGSAKVSLASGHLPGNTKADVSELLNTDWRVKAAAGIASKGRLFAEMASMPEGVNAYRILVEQIQEAANKKKSVEEALEFATAEWNKLLAKYA